MYLDRGEFDVRLGTVGPQGTRTLELPSFLREGENVMVFVHPEGGTDLATPGFTVKKGKNLDILVPTNDVGYVPPQPPELTPNSGKGTVGGNPDRDGAANPGADTRYPRLAYRGEAHRGDLHSPGRGPGPLQSELHHYAGFPSPSRGSVARGMSEPGVCC